MAAEMRDGTQTTSLQTWAATRSAYLDNLKVLLIAGIIVIHGVLGYAGSLEVWTYTEFREVTLSPVTEGVLFLLVSPFGLFLIALLFLVSGLLTPPSHERKGPRRFVVDRLLRLGVVFGVYVLVLQPVLLFFLLHNVGDDRSFAQTYLASGRLDTGPLWFVGVLLVFSLLYAGWHALLRPRPVATPITLRTLLLIAVVVAPLSFAVRLIWSYGSEAGVTDLNFWQWPVCLAVFGLGTVAFHQGWLTTVPSDLARQCRTVTAASVAAMAVLLVVVGSQDALEDALGGWHWSAAAFAIVEGPLTLCGSVWLLALAQRRLDRHYRRGPVLARSAFAAFIVQTAVLLALAIALRPVDAPAEIKALLVAVGGMVGSFAIGWLLATKVPGLRRIL